MAPSLGSLRSPGLGALTVSCPSPILCSLFVARRLGRPSARCAIFCDSQRYALIPPARRALAPCKSLSEPTTYENAGGQGRICTFVGSRQRVYSPPHLAALVPARFFKVVLRILLFVVFSGQIFARLTPPRRMRGNSVP